MTAGIAGRVAAAGFDYDVVALGDDPLHAMSLNRLGESIMSVLIAGSGIAVTAS
jgi:hypothetical protein